MARDSAHWAEPFISSINSAFPSAEMAVDLPNQTPFFKWVLLSVNHTPKVLLESKGGASCIGEDDTWLIFLRQSYLSYGFSGSPS